MSSDWDQIVESQIVLGHYGYQALNKETQPQQCGINLGKRLRYLNKKFFKDETGFLHWNLEEEYNENYDDGYLCLCGQLIANVFQLRRGSVDITIGSSCLKKFTNEELVQQYNKHKRQTVNCLNCNRRIKKTWKRTICHKCTNIKFGRYKNGDWYEVYERNNQYFKWAQQNVERAQFILNLVEQEILLEE